MDNRFLIKDAEIPAYMRVALHAYLDYGRPVGDFLNAILTNNLFHAVGHADSTNIKIIQNYVVAIHTHAPAGCHGSKQKVDAWIALGGLRGLEKENANRE